MTGTQAQGLSAVHPDLEHRPRDPFEVDVSAALEALDADWGGRWMIWHQDGCWHARPRGCPAGTLTCETPDELVRAMRGYGGMP